MFSISRIQQLIKPISRGRFKRLAEQHQADRYVKRFDSWQHLLAMLYEHMTNAEFSCRFRWEPNSIAFWDNRATAHLVPTDVPAGHHRSMQRITLAGDLTVGVDGQQSYALSGDTSFE